MGNTIQLLKDGQPVFPVTDVSLVMGLQDAIKLPPVKVTTLPTASADTAGKMYYVGPDGNDEYERYITSAVGGSYSWIDLGDTSIPLPSIADNLTTADANTALSANQGVVLAGQVGQLDQKVTVLDDIFIDENDETFAWQDATYNQGFNTNRIIADKSMQFKDGDKLVSVTLKAPTTENSHISRLYVYNEQGVAVLSNHILGTIGTTDKTFDVSSLNIVLKEGYSVAVNGLLVGSFSSSNRFYDYNSSAYITSYCYGLAVTVKRATSDFEGLPEKVDELGDAIFTESTINGTVVSGKAYSLTVNQAPAQNDDESYNAVIAENLVAGDQIEIIARSGSSYPTWAKTKNGVVIWASDTALNVDTNIICDGSFDAIIANSYTFYVASPSITVTHKCTYTEVLEEEIDDIQDGVYAQTQRSGEKYVNMAFTLAVGDAPSSGNANSYIALVAGNLKKGDSIAIKAKSGSSYSTYGYIKNGLVTYVSGALADVDTTIVCDGSFDTIIVNDYTYYVPSPSCVITFLESAFEYIDRKSKKDIKVLAIGNSFTNDSFGYIPALLNNFAPDVQLTIAIGYIGGSPLAQHLAYFTGESITLDDKMYYTEGGQYKRKTVSTGAVDWSGLYTLYVSENGKPWYSTPATVQQMLDFAEWDIITFQQSGGRSNSDWDTYYAPYIYALQQSLFSKIDYPTRLGWVLVHGAYGNSDASFLSKWEGTAVNAEKVMLKTGASILFPYGTAVQNLRTTTLKSLGDGEHHNLTVDDAHLQEGIGPLAAAYTNLLTIMRALGVANGVIGDGTRPDASFLTSWNVPEPNVGTGVIGISDANCFLAQVAAEKAVMNPYEVTDLSVFQS